MSLQAPSAVVMIRPYGFRSSPETCIDNAFQTTGPCADADAAIAARAGDGVDQAVAVPGGAGGTVHVLDVFDAPGAMVIDPGGDQIAGFAGNAIKMEGNGRGLRALSALRADQRAVIARTAQPLPLSVPTIETAGGSVRCMIAGIHLARRPEFRFERIAS